MLKIQELHREISFRVDCWISDRCRKPIRRRPQTRPQTRPPFQPSTPGPGSLAPGRRRLSPGPLLPSSPAALRPDTCPLSDIPRHPARAPALTYNCKAIS
jgi:hypothetical protein